MAEINPATLTKLYYSIGEVAAMFEVNTSLLRFWEKEFKFEVGKKNAKGNRMYNKKEIEFINTVYQLVKIQGFTLDGAKLQIKSQSGKSIKLDLVDRLEQIKKRLISLKTS